MATSLSLRQCIVMFVALAGALTSGAMIVLLLAVAA
jgi:hypothetical protein